MSSATRAFLEISFLLCNLLGLAMSDVVEGVTALKVVAATADETAVVVVDLVTRVGHRLDNCFSAHRQI
jgi:hypothetical protein